MNRAEIFEQVQQIFRTVFDNDSLILNDQTNAGDIEDWDSLEQINLLTAMEKKFSIKFEISEVVSLANVGEMVDLLEKKVS